VAQSTPELEDPMADQLDYVLDLRAVLKAVLKWSWVILIFALAGLVYGVNETTNFVPKYTAKMTISPKVASAPIGGGTASSGPGLKSTLAAVLGNNSPATTGEMFQRLRLIMKSQQLARRLDEEHGLSRDIFASSWDSEKGAWKTPIKTEPTWRQRLNTYLQQTQSLEPGTEALASAVGGMIEFIPVEETLFWEVQIMHPEGEAALRWLTMIFTTADELLREQGREKLRQQVNFLRLRLEKAELGDLRAALYGALLNGEKALHMTKSNLPYAADIIEPAFVSALKTKPNLTKLIAVPTLGAAFAALLLVLMISIFLRE
jgi:hypothetical protein